MSSQDVHPFSLEALNSVDAIIIRPFSRYEQFAGYLAYHLQPSHEKVRTFHPVLFNLEVEESKELVRVKDNSREVHFTCTDGLSDSNQVMTIYSIDKSIVGRIYDPFVLVEDRDKSDGYTVFDKSLNPTEFELTASSTAEAAQVRAAVEQGHKVMCYISSNERGSTLSLHFYNKLSSLGKLILMLAGLRLLYCRCRYNKHPVPTNILSTKEASTPLIKPVLEAFNKALLRIAFSSIEKYLYADLMNTLTHKSEIVVEYAVDDEQTVTFKDIFGVVQLTSKYAKGECQQLSVCDSAGEDIGSIINQSGQKQFVDATSKSVVMLERTVEPSASHDTDATVHQIYLASKSGSVVCEYYMHRRIGIVNVNCEQTAGVMHKSLIIAHIAHVSVKQFSNILSFIIPTVYRYPFKTKV